MVKKNKLDHIHAVLEQADALPVTEIQIDHLVFHFTSFLVDSNPEKVTFQFDLDQKTKQFPLSVTLPFRKIQKAFIHDHILILKCKL